MTQPERDALSELIERANDHDCVVFGVDDVCWKCEHIDKAVHTLAALRAPEQHAFVATPGFIEMIENPPEPNDKLREALERHTNEVDSRPEQHDERPVLTDEQIVAESYEFAKAAILDSNEGTVARGWRDKWIFQKGMQRARKMLGAEGGEK